MAYDKKKGVRLLWCLECVFGNEGVSDYLSFCIHPKCTAASMCTHCSKSKAACLRCSFAWKRKKWFAASVIERKKKKKSQAPHDAFKSLKWFLHSTQMLSAVWTNTINIFHLKNKPPYKNAALRKYSAFVLCRAEQSGLYAAGLQKLYTVGCSSSSRWHKVSFTVRANVSALVSSQQLKAVMEKWTWSAWGL